MAIQLPVSLLSWYKACTRGRALLPYLPFLPRLAQTFEGRKPLRSNQRSEVLTLTP
jgi:hypothetical protein